MCIQDSNSFWLLAHPPPSPATSALPVVPNAHSAGKVRPTTPPLSPSEVTTPPAAFPPATSIQGTATSSAPTLQESSTPSLTHGPQTDISPASFPLHHQPPCSNQPQHSHVDIFKQPPPNATAASTKQLAHTSQASKGATAHAWKQNMHARLCTNTRTAPPIWYLPAEYTTSTDSS